MFNDIAVACFSHIQCGMFQPHIISEILYSCNAKSFPITITQAIHGKPIDRTYQRMASATIPMASATIPAIPWSTILVYIHKRSWITQGDDFLVALLWLRLIFPCLWFGCKLDHIDQLREHSVAGPGWLQVATYLALSPSRICRSFFQLHCNIATEPTTPIELQHKLAIWQKPPVAMRTAAMVAFRNEVDLVFLMRTIHKWQEHQLFATDSSIIIMEVIIFPTSVLSLVDYLHEGPIMIWIWLHFKLDSVCKCHPQSRCASRAYSNKWFAEQTKSSAWVNRRLFMWWNIKKVQRHGFKNTEKAITNKKKQFTDIGGEGSLVPPHLIEHFVFFYFLKVFECFFTVFATMPLFLLFCFWMVFQYSIRKWSGELLLIF